MRADNVANLSQLLQRRIALTPDNIAYRQFDGKQWYELSWRETGNKVACWQKALMAYDLQPGDCVAICAQNCLEWVLFDQAAMGLGLVLVPLYYNDRPENMAWCLNNSAARLLLLQDDALWHELAEQVQTVEYVICIENIPHDDNRVQSLEQWLPPSGDTLHITKAQPHEQVTIVYTSGTTGRPKGVMLSHDNILSNVIALGKACPEIDEADTFLSFLPMSHMLERTVGYYIGIHVGAKTVFARGVPQLGEDLRQQRPTIIVSVPRIFERAYSKIQENLSTSIVKRAIFDKTVELGWRRYQGQLNTLNMPLWWLLNFLVARRIRARFGGRLRYVLVGGAAMPEPLLKIFMALGLTFLHGYGLTETSPVVSFNRVKDNVPFSVGRPLEDIEVCTGEAGELLVRGPNVMLGYWNDSEATAQVIDQDKWFHTGDVAKIIDGRIYITDRLKDIIVLTNGEKIPPKDAEQAILADPLFEQVLVIGEGRPKLGLLVVTRVRDTKQLCQRANELLVDFPGYARICHVAVFTEPWTVENGLMTPTLKLRRKALLQQFASEIDAMYQRNCDC